MQNILPQNLIALSRRVPVFVVGGVVRDFLAGLTSSSRDWDICSPVPAEDFARAALECGFEVIASYPATGSLKLACGGENYEFTRFRSDSYGGNGHAPERVSFTVDLQTDAARRDFTCNAVYYDISAGQFIDPLGGRGDISAKILRPCAPADKLFAEDAVRVLRLARFCGELGFVPTEGALRGARRAARNINSLSPYRVWSELSAMLKADEKYGVEKGCLRALSVLAKVGALEVIFPSFADMDGDGVCRAICAVQRAEISLRLPALIYFAGEGAVQAFPVPAKQKKMCCRLAECARFSGKGSGEVRAFVQRNADILAPLCALRRAVAGDGAAEEWERTFALMRAEGVPFSLSELAVRGGDLIAEGIPPAMVGSTLNYLLWQCAACAALNCRARLLPLARDYCQQRGGK